MENENKLATELLGELKASAKRWFIIALVELVLILGIIIGFLWYVSLPVSETTTTEQTVDDVDVNRGAVIQRIEGNS